MPELPISLRAEHTIIHPNVNGVTIAVGQERLIIGDEMDAQNRVAIGARIEWVAGVHLTPVAAKMLAAQMAEFLELYERKYGTIPTDLPPEPPKEIEPGVVQLRPPSAATPSTPPATEAPPLNQPDQAAQIQDPPKPSPYVRYLERLLGDPPNPS